jgi:asparagine synthase (glutamine-hydrolysing)
MCGIGGWVDWRRDMRQEEEVLAAMQATLACRGPDAEGRFLAGPVGFVHRRLAVVDLVGGAQPMAVPKLPGEVVITYNGELYNLPELSAELAARGVRLSTSSDTEVLLQSYLVFGEACVERLDGIFAFAIWDSAEQKLFAARDRLGVKPFFYCERQGGFIFGSELKTLLAHPLVEPVVEADGLAEVFVMAPSRTPGHGVFRDVYELLPGSALTFSRRGLSVRRYWRLESRPHEDDEDTTALRVRELLASAVRRQLISDVPLGVLLSGGLDSSAVAAFAADAFRREGRGRLVTYSVDFHDNDRYFTPNAFQTQRDAPWVERVSRLLDTEHRLVEFHADELVHALPWALRARDVPGMADVDTSLLLFAREIKREMTVMLSGEAADELFGGYPWCHMEPAIAADTFPWARRLSERVSFLTPALREHIRPEAYVEARYREALAEVPRLPGEEGRPRRMREILYLNLTRFLPTLLDRKDRMTMAVGLEVRVPFCDHRLVEYVWNIPWEMKKADGIPKGILRRALLGVLPHDVLYRPKSPYPSTHHPSYFTLCRDWALDLLSDPGTPLREFLQRGQVERLAEASDLLGSELPWFGQILGAAQFFAYIVQLDLWFRTYRVRVA